MYWNRSCNIRKFKVVRLVTIATLILACSIVGRAQDVPSKEEGIDYLMTFSNGASVKWGDDDHAQTFFFLLPKSYQKEFYIHVFDPEIGGTIDKGNGPFNSSTKFSIYGGKGCYSNKDATGIQPKGDFKSGTFLKSKTFGNEAQYDNSWYTFGPFNPLEGEYVDQYNGNVFKIIAEGLSGDDGNLYRYFLSQEKEEQVSVEGGNAFTFEYAFRLNPRAGSVAHLYPFIEDDVISVKQNNFDFDMDGEILIYSPEKNGHRMNKSDNGNWGVGTMPIKDSEKQRSLDMRIIKKSSGDNDMVVYMVNQYNKPVPFFASPLGAAPKYQYKNTIRKVGGR